MPTCPVTCFSPSASSFILLYALQEHEEFPLCSNALDITVILFFKILILYFLPLPPSRGKGSTACASCLVSLCVLHHYLIVDEIKTMSFPLDEKFNIKVDSIVIEGNSNTSLVCDIYSDIRSDFIPFISNRISL